MQAFLGHPVRIFIKYMVMVAEIFGKPIDKYVNRYVITVADIFGTPYK